MLKPRSGLEPPFLPVERVSPIALQFLEPFHSGDAESVSRCSSSSASGLRGLETRVHPATHGPHIGLDLLSGGNESIYGLMVARLKCGYRSHSGFNSGHLVIEHTGATHMLAICTLESFKEQRPNCGSSVCGIRMVVDSSIALRH